MHKYFILVLIFSIFFSCKEDDCYEPSDDIVLEFVNENNENLIANGSIDITTISINKVINPNEHIGITGNSIINNKLVINSQISRFDGPQDFILSNNMKIIYFHIISSKVINCDSYNLHGITFDSVNYSKQDNHYRITL